MKILNKKVSAIVVLILVLVVGGYLAWQKKGEDKTPEQVSVAGVIDWQSLIPEIRPILANAFLKKFAIETEHPINIGETIDITGDGISEAFVGLGTGGAAIDFLTLMATEGGKPVMATFKEKDGTITSSKLLGDGAGGSGRYGTTTVMLSDKNAIYFANYYLYGESTDMCTLDAYQWNSNSKMFEFNLEITNQFEPDYCKKAHESADEVSNPTSNWKKYANTKYGFEFKYPFSWKIIEKKNTQYPSTFLTVGIVNPDFPKKVYDCCYTSEEVQKYGKVPSLDIQVIDSNLYYSPNSKDSWGSQAKVLFSELISKGYYKESLEKTLTWLPTGGQGDPVIWEDACEKSELLKINNEYAIKSSGCSEGVVENTQALFIERNGYIFKLSDNASEYLNIQAFDQILSTFKFTK